MANRFGRSLLTQAHAFVLCSSLLGCSERQTSAPSAQPDAGAPVGQGGSSGTGGSSGNAGLSGLAGATASGGSSGNGGSAGAGGQLTMEAGPPAPPSAYITTDDLSQALASATLNMGAASKADATVTFDPSTTYQVMNGFGASITDSSSYVMTKYLSADALQQAMVKLFDPNEGAGLNFLRQPMGASDFSSVGNFSYDDNAGNADPTLANFNITQDLKATIPLLKQSLAINPAIFILATEWSPPAWMKNNHSMNGSGSGGGDPGLNPADYETLAQYFVKFVQAYAAQGITVNAVTPQNEPQNGAAAYPGMDLNAPSELQLIAQNMGPAFKSANLSTLLWAFDHNWDNEAYPEQIMGDATAASFTEGAAFHCYGGDPSAMTTFHDKFPMKSIYMTECSGGDWQDDPFANTIELEINSTANWAQAISLWNMALDENDGPKNNGCSGCRGVITVNSKTSDVTYTVDYYALAHFSKFVRPGALRISSRSSNGALNQVAFKNKDGRLAVIGHNTGKNTLVVQIGSGASAMNVSVPANAAVTVAWTPAAGAQ
jgi:glucosylceramidase